METASQPVLIIIAGPNGSGKSTITKKLEQNADFPKLYINADDIKKNEGLTDLEAWEKAEKLREDALSIGESFAFETVFSHESKLDLMKQAKKAGYCIELYFLCLQDSDINVKRVQQRHKNGGHGVPVNKIKSRYDRSIQLLRQSFQLADKVMVFNNSFEKPELIARKNEDGQVHIYPLHDKKPESIWTTIAVKELIGLNNDINQTDL